MIPSLLTVIVPVYNVEKYIHRCVNSILNQKYSPLELILVDDGSTDLSGEICEEYAKKDERVKVFHIENGGAAAARNEGLRNAQGEFITFVDSDDWLSEETYAVAMANFMDADVVRFGVKVELENNCTRFGIEEYFKIEENETCKIKHSMILTSELTVWNKIFRRKIIEDNKLFFPHGVRFEDNAFAALYMLYADTVRTIGSKYYHYFIRNDSVMGKHHVLFKSQETATTYITLFTYIYENMPESDRSFSSFADLLFLNFTFLAIGFFPMEKRHEVVDRALDVAKKLNLDPTFVDFMTNVKFSTLIKISFRNFVDLLKHGDIFLFKKYQKDVLSYWKRNHISKEHLLQ